MKKININLKKMIIKKPAIKMGINIMKKSNLIKEDIQMKIVQHKNKDIQVINLIILGKDNNNKIITSVRPQSLLKIKKF